jgi:hypothetical protein
MTSCDLLKTAIVAGRFRNIPPGHKSQLVNRLINKFFNMHNFINDNWLRSWSIEANTLGTVIAI